MYKPLLLLVALLCTYVSYGQKTDTLVVFYKSDQHIINQAEKRKLDSFLQQGWDKILIRGYTDETDEEAYNIELSKKRSAGIYDYFISRNIPADKVSFQYFGEAMPVASNSSDEGRSLNRRTEIIGYKFLRRAYKPPVDPMKPLTSTLDNGFIITYRPGTLPSGLADNFLSGSSENFRLVTNTTEMRQNNLFNNTTNGEILSSVLIVCGQKMDPCKLDSPILIKVPIPFKTTCPISKVKFFNAVAVRGKQIWQEENKDIFPETINGRQYVGIWMDNFCQCINFDFKVDPECYETDSAQLMYVHANIRNLTTELAGLNSVYIPRKKNDSTHNILFLKNSIKNALLSFSLYNGKRRIKSFYNQALTAFPYNDQNEAYVLSTDTVRFYFPGTRYGDVIVRVNADNYRTFLDSSRCEVIYLNRSSESIMVDFAVVSKRKKIIQFRNYPLALLPYDEKLGTYVIDKRFLKTLDQQNALTMR